MSGAKDPAIKLFGRTIPVPEAAAAAAAAGDDSPVAASPAAARSSCSPSSSSSTPSSAAAAFASADESNDENRLSSSPEEDNKSSTVEDGRRGEKELLEKAPNGTHEQGNGHLPIALQEEPTYLNSSSVVNENHPTANELPSKPEEGHSEISAAQEKTLKKPDKILACPRCNSMETKFCYFNNYNVNQPRHFCKNCQRYWTAGGTMRNVPVGAGRRKNKNITSHYRHFAVSESLQSAQIDMPNATNHPSLKASRTVLAFGSKPLCESMTSALNLAEKTARNGFHRPEDLRIPSFSGDGQRGNDQVTRSVVPTSNPKDEMGKSCMPEPAMQNYEGGFPPQAPCFPCAPWAYPWNTSQWRSPMPSAPFSMPFYPAAAYWGCTAPGSWNVPWVSQPSQNRVTAASGPNSPTLGKHSRDESPFKPNSLGEEKHVKGNAEKCIWIPKTVRIDDPGEAAKISIWATLGIDNDKVQLGGGRGFFKTTESKDEDKSSQMADTSPLLKANPAALSRSLNFQESS